MVRYCNRKKNGLVGYDYLWVCDVSTTVFNSNTIIVPKKYLLYKEKYKEVVGVKSTKIFFQKI